MPKRMEEKLKATSKLYQSRHNCVDTILSAYSEELACSQKKFEDLEHRLKMAVGSDQLPCAAISTAATVLNLLKEKPVDEKVLQNRIETMIKHEYGAITCKEILKNKTADQQCCELHMKNLVLIIENFRD